MAENQNTEWKESWRDEYLRWICGLQMLKVARYTLEPMTMAMSSVYRIVKSCWKIFQIK